MISPYTLSRKVWTAIEVHSLRVSMGMTQEQFAHRLGVTVVSVNRWERGVSKPRGLSINALNNLIMMITKDEP
jgi:putative transcriptional regulator